MTMATPSWREASGTIREAGQPVRRECGDRVVDGARIAAQAAGNRRGSLATGTRQEDLAAPQHEGVRRAQP
ncbi:MAG TPA: hypothetical protein VIV57_15765, partial [Anaeromyxobacter sp.]